MYEVLSLLIWLFHTKRLPNPKPIWNEILQETFASISESRLLSTLPGWVTIPLPWASRLLWEELFGWAFLFYLRIHFVHWSFPVFLSRTRWVPWRHWLCSLFPLQCHMGNILFGGIIPIHLLARNKKTNCDLGRLQSRSISGLEASFCRTVPSMGLPRVEVNF